MRLDGEPRQQSSEMRKGRGYKGQGKSKKGKERPPDFRKVEDRTSKCAACGKYGHWRGDAVCSKTKSGEVPARSAGTSSKGAGSVKEEPGTLISTKEESESPKRGEDQSKVSVSRVNWTFMVGSGWDLLEEYDSEEGDRSSSTSSEELTPAVAAAPASAGHPPKGKKTKMRLRTVLAALEQAVEGEEEKKKLRRARRKQKAKKEDADMAVDPDEILAILPNLTKAEKRSLLKQLLNEEEEEAAQYVPPTEEFPVQRRRGHHQAEPARGATSKSRAAPKSPSLAATSSPSLAASSSAGPSTEDVPLPVKKRLEEFRRQLYSNALNVRGKIMLSEASDIPRGEQEACTHDYSLLKWGANGSAHWADCTGCKLKKVLYWSRVHGSLMANTEEDGGLPTMDLIMDTGCRTAVAGQRWHERYQSHLRALGLQWLSVEHEEVFRFGAGRPVLSTEAKIYPIWVGETPSWLRLAVVESEKDSRVAECPALAGPSELARWAVRMDFAKQGISIQGGQWQTLRLSQSRHPVLNVLPHKGATMSQWETPELVELRQRLEVDPYSMALIQEQVTAIETEMENMELEATSEEDSHETAEMDNEEFEQAAALWQERMDDEAFHKWDGLALPSEAFRATQGASDTEEDTSTGTISDAHSVSEEDANDIQSEDSDESSSDESTEYETILVAEAGCADEEALTKGQKRRLLAASKTIGEAASYEVDHRKPPLRRSLRTSFPWKLIEIYTWSCMITRAAYARGWETFEPVTLPGWDIRLPEVQKQAFAYLERIDPDVIVVAWPCGPWSPLQRLNVKTPQQRRALRRKRLEARRTLLSFTRKVVLWQRRRGKAVLGENSHPSLAWETEEIQEAFHGCAEAVADQCRFGLVHPVNKVPLKKRTRFMGTEELVAPLRLKCDGSHSHWPIEGKYKDEDGKWQALSEWAGGYPIALCNAILDGAENFMRRQPNVLVEDPGEEGVLSEGDMIDGEDAIQEEEQILDDALKKDEEDLQQEMDDDQRHPIPREVQKAVEFSHRQLGHPSRSTLVRMLKMSGATEDAIRYAKRWQCPVCAQRAAPKHPQAAAPSVRPYGFNVHIHIDIKYVYDARRKRYACLSMVDLGTVKHDAVMVKTKQSQYVARKFFRHWVSIYGPPAKITMDQGGEFEKTFLLYLEQMSIPTDITASHAGWQLAAGERHGGLLADLMQAIVHEHSLEGYHAMKEGLAAAVQAKNSTLTKDGFTPNQRVFGFECKWPSLNDEEVKLSFAEGLSVESEVARAHRMRTTARVALIRNDVREKMRRSVLRKPAVSQSGPFIPGAQIYFWVPSSQKGVRYRKGGMWRGPATVLTREKNKRYFASWRGRLLLIAEENMRLSTKEELALTEAVREDMDSVGDALRDGNIPNLFRDLRPRAPPPRRPARKRKPTPPEPEEAKRARLMMQGTKAVRNLMQDKTQRNVQLQQRRTRQVRTGRRQRRPTAPPKASASVPIPAAPEERKSLAAPALEDSRGMPKRRRQLAIEDREPAATEHEEEHEEPAASGYEDETPAIEDVSAEPRAEEIPVPEIADSEEEEEQQEREPAAAVEPTDEDFQTELTQRQTEEHRRHLLDDVPLSLKRRLHQEDQEPAAPPGKRARVTESLVAQVMLGTLHAEDGRANEWVNQYELALLRELTGLPLTSARLHRQPRKKMARPPKLASRARLSILIGQDPRDAFVVEENTKEVEQNPRRKASFPWRGISMYYKEKPANRNERVKSYVEKDGEVYEVQWSRRQRRAFEREWQAELKDVLLSQVMLLKMKQSGKELDPRFFDEEEKRLFKEADRKEWAQWIQNGVVRRLTPQERNRVQKHNVFRSPMRMVRTNKQQKMLLPILAKSRLVIPGHTDPNLGFFRTDSPTTSLTSVRLAKAIGQFRNWTVWSFDVTTAFLSGLETQRELYVKAPADGLPPTDGWDVQSYLMSC